MPATETISVECPCGKRLKAPATAVGRKAKCPSCGQEFQVDIGTGATALGES